MLPAVSSASSGDNSIETQPSTRSRGIEDRLEQIGRSTQIFQRQLDEQRFARFSGRRLGADTVVVRVAGADRFVEDRRIRCQPGDRELVDVAPQRTVVEDAARNVVEPDALAKIVQTLRVVHATSSKR